MKFESLVPILYSEDIKRSIAYYTGVLGFTNQWIWDDDATFGGVDHDCVNLFFCKEGQGNHGTWFCIMVDDVDAYYETIKARGAIILSAPDDKPWLIREMLVQDPDEHVIRFGTRLEEEE